MKPFVVKINASHYEKLRHMFNAVHTHASLNNRMLRILDLGEYTFSKNETTAIILALQKNQSLKYLRPLPEFERGTIVKCLNINRLMWKRNRSKLFDSLIPNLIVYCASNKQHVSKVFNILRQKPDLFIRGMTTTDETKPAGGNINTKKRKHCFLHQ